ncbi:MAG TPA: hypothetical protein VJ255_06305, partial [Candidatus Acidoferrum sp.]|nr:hypothetical protein [Candidatus Acidoferrum sp.]
MWPNGNVHRRPLAQSSSGPTLRSALKTCFTILFLLLLTAPAVAANSWKGILRDASAHALGGATVSLQSA